ncbi:PIN domain-containing protein [Edaphobacter sp. DSM 109919]|uniref:PIN domain-containing protein n=1 Tax=Edaphobacter paludis TaxID=3035702 RepID=A0AAU7CU54_9BACT
MAILGAFFDANVLYPSGLRNFLMHLSLTGIFRAHWSPEVHDEWIRNLLKNRPDITRDKLERIRRLMDQAAPDALVTGYEPLIESIELPDPDDRHVLAAAIRCGASVIVTLNLSDFPNAALADFGIEAQHPDEFVLSLIETFPALVLEAARTHRASLRNPSKTPDEYLADLNTQELGRSAATLRELIAGQDSII